MKIKAALLLGLAMCAALQAQDRTSLFREAGVVMFNDKIPAADYDFPIKLLTGTNKNLSSYKGNVVFINFWATWCAPCRSEMPSMQTLYARYKNRSFTLVAVNLGETKTEVEQFMQKQNLNFPVGLDEKNYAGYVFGVRAIPTSYLIDKFGNIVGGVQGSIRWDTPAMYALFNYLLNE